MPLDTTGMTGARTLAETAARELRAEMARQQITSAAVAQALGVSDMYISRRTRGEVPLDLADLEKIAALLRVPVTQFIGEPIAASAA